MKNYNIINEDDVFLYKFISQFKFWFSLKSCSVTLN